MRVIHTIAGTRLDHGGTSRSVPATCDALTQLGVETHLVTAAPADRSVACGFPRDMSRVHLATESAAARQWGVGRQFQQHLERLCSADAQRPIIHDHGVWLSTNHSVARFASSHRLMRVVSPRGMLGAWALNRAMAKKRLAWWLYQRSDLARATAFHATSQQEADDIRSLGFRQPIAVIPNGVDFPDRLPQRKSTDTRQVLFMSRIHPVKGLMNLLQAWKQAGINSNWRLVLAGPDENGHRAQVEREAQRLGLNGHVVFPGPVDDQDKWQLLVDSDLFVLPSFSENFGIVIAEAMAAGLPVITTTATPWQVLADQQMGWWVAPTVAELSDSLKTATAADGRSLIDMGRRASEHVRNTLGWPQIGQQLRQFYQWISGCETKPNFMV